MPTRLLVTTVAVALLVAQSTDAFGRVIDSSFHADADDASALDIRLVGLIERTSPHRWTISIRTFERIQFPSESDGLYAQFDVRGGPRWDYGVHVWNDTGSSGIYCDWDVRKGQQGQPFSWSVKRRLAKCTFGRIRRSKPIRFRTWSTTSGSISDRAPDGGGWYG